MHEYLSYFIINITYLLYNVFICLKIVLAMSEAKVHVLRRRNEVSTNLVCLSLVTITIVHFTPPLHSTPLT